MFGHGSHHVVTVDDANGNLNPGVIFGDEPKEEGESANVWCFWENESGFGGDRGVVELRVLKRDADGHFVA
jgi:hypothetical protein